MASSEGKTKASYAICARYPSSATRPVYTLILHRSCKDEVLQKLKEIGFAHRWFCVMFMKRLRTAFKPWTRKRQAEVTASQTETSEQIAALAEHIDTLRRLYDLLASKRDRLLAAKQLTESEKTFFLQGWIPAPMAEKAETQLRKVSPTVALEFYDPLEGEEPPVLLHNPKIATPFESVVSGFRVAQIQQL